MIAARQIAFGKAAGAKKPYDAEIEYLESTGTQYIDTGVVVDTTTIWRVSCAVTDTATQFMGVIDKNAMRYHLSFYDSGHTRGCMGAIQSDIGTPNLEFNEYELNCTTKTASMNGVPAECDYTKQGGIIPSLSIWLFGRNSDRVSYRRMINIKVGMSNIWKSGILVLDLIPVRKGNVGYMYDRVSGQLFGNQGTGEFVLGPDIIDYTAKDYVQDGLVAMWDGIESPLDVTSWIDLTHGYELAFTKFVRKDMSYKWYIEDGRIDNAEFYKPTSGAIVDVLAEYNSADNTVEFCVGDVSSSYIQGITSASNHFGRGMVSGNSTSVYLRSADQTYRPSNTIIPTQGSTVSSSAVIEDGKIYGWFNGEALLYASQPPVAEVEAVRFVINRANAYRSFRIYNRALTAEEIAHNYEIDKARFGL